MTVTPLPLSFGVTRSFLETSTYCGNGDAQDYRSIPYLFRTVDLDKEVDRTAPLDTYIRNYNPTSDRRGSNVRGNGAFDCSDCILTSRFECQDVGGSSPPCNYHEAYLPPLSILNQLLGIIYVLVSLFRTCIFVPSTKTQS